MATQLQPLHRQIPAEVETLATQEGLPRDRVYEIYLAEQAKLARGAKIMTFVPTLVLRQVRCRIRQARYEADGGEQCAHSPEGGRKLDERRAG